MTSATLEGDSAYRKEYKTILKSVIQCQVQALLEKLSTDTGEESLVIYTNLNSLVKEPVGSQLGQKFLQRACKPLEDVCENFRKFCNGVQTKDLLASEEKTKDTLDTGEEQSGMAYAEGYIDPVEADTLKSHSTTEESRIKEMENVVSPIKKELAKMFTNKRKLRKESWSARHRSNEKMVSLNTSLSSDVDSGRPADVEAMSGGKKTDFQMLNIKTEPEEECKVDNNGSIEEHHLTHVDPSSMNYHSPEKVNILGGLELKGNKNMLGQNDGEMKSSSVTSRPFIPLANIYNRYSLGQKDRYITELENKHNQYVTELEHNQNQLSVPVTSTEDVKFENSDPSYSDFMDESYSEVRDADVTDAAKQYMVSFAGTNVSSLENIHRTELSDSSFTPGYRVTEDKPNFLPSHLVLGPKYKKREVEDKNLDHVMKRNAEGKIIYECQKCYKELSHQASYRRHMKIHDDHRPYNCAVCGKGFIRKYHAERHLTQHHMKMNSAQGQIRKDNPEMTAISTTQVGTSFESGNLFENQALVGTSCPPDTGFTNLKSEREISSGSKRRRKIKLYKMDGSVIETYDSETENVEQESVHQSESSAVVVSDESDYEDMSAGGAIGNVANTSNRCVPKHRRKIKLYKMDGTVIEKYDSEAEDENDMVSDKSDCEGMSGDEFNQSDDGSVVYSKSGNMYLRKVDPESGSENQQQTTYDSYKSLSEQLNAVEEYNYTLGQN